jgi:hypothetical protein
MSDTIDYDDDWDYDPEQLSVRDFVKAEKAKRLAKKKASVNNWCITTDYVDFHYIKQIASTDKAILILTYCGSEIWIPRSAIDSIVKSGHIIVNKVLIESKMSDVDEHNVWRGAPRGTQPQLTKQAKFQPNVEQSAIAALGKMSGERKMQNRHLSTIFQENMTTIGVSFNNGKSIYTYKIDKTDHKEVAVGGYVFVTTGGLVAE